MIFTYCWDSANGNRRVSHTECVGRGARKQYAGWGWDGEPDELYRSGVQEQSLELRDCVHTWALGKGSCIGHEAYQALGGALRVI